VSTTFSPTAVLPGVDDAHTDVAIVAGDGVFFFASQSVLRGRSSNLFGQLLPAPFNFSFTPSITPTAYDSVGSDPPDSLWATYFERQSPPSSPSSPAPVSAPPDPFLTFIVTERSSVLDIILRIIYIMTLEENGADLDVLDQALGSLEKYGIAIPEETSAVWGLVLQLAPSNPIRAYAIAASYAIESCCISTSRYTLQMSLNTLTEADALTMGPIYMRRLFFLHLGRRDALKRVINESPTQHPPTESCPLSIQNETGRSWAIAVAKILIHPMAHGTSIDVIVETLGPLVRERTCQTCQTNVRVRVSQVIRDWLQVKVTI